MGETPKTPDQYAAASFPLTPEELAALPHDNAAPYLLASIWSLALASTIFLCLRIHYPLSSVCIIIECSVLSYATSFGYGLHIWDFDMRYMDDLLLPTNVAGTFSITAAAWSKTSFGLTLLHITDGWHKRLTWFCIISMNVAMTVSALIPWITCAPVQKSWEMTVEGTCWDPKVAVYYNLFSSGYSALMDFTLALLPWKFLWGLQMKRKEKLGAGLAMSMGVFAGATAVVKTSKIPRLLAADFAQGISLWVWGNAEVCSSVIATSIPMLRVLARDAKTSLEHHRSGSNFYDKEMGIASSSNNRSRVVTATSRPPLPNDSEHELHMQKSIDDRSDRSILANDGEPEPLQTDNGILRVTDITVQYDKEGVTTT
ncbi:uncharacterized protein B0H64DRAFT_418034 [Chaetomium fimeti]|uniref:Rhodopsin domain-containing protein n=1 Tax=Chaetomium fimeti TaxID=1854472 RepID=A0AAE0LQC8_9PEZI|nr:hypothetical protein B0H64DRAFT_418034 [Chaetomium fimeti]